MYAQQINAKNEDDDIGSKTVRFYSVLPWKIKETQEYAQKLMDDKQYLEAIKELEELPELPEYQHLMLEKQALLMFGYSRAVMHEIHSGVSKGSQMIQEFYQKGTALGKILMLQPQYQTKAQTLQEILDDWAQ